MAPRRQPRRRSSARIPARFRRRTRSQAALAPSVSPPPLPLPLPPPQSTPAHPPEPASASSSASHSAETVTDFLIQQYVDEFEAYVRAIVQVCAAAIARINIIRGGTFTATEQAEVTQIYLLIMASNLSVQDRAVATFGEDEPGVLADVLEMLDHALTAQTRLLDAIARMVPSA